MLATDRVSERERPPHLYPARASNRVATAHSSSNWDLPSPPELARLTALQFGGLPRIGA
jgi:hypothetical protein